jgi:hypothetical protein
MRSDSPGNRFASLVAYLEVLLSDDDMLAQLSKEQRRTVLAETLIKYKAKHSLGDVLNQTGIMFSLLLMGRTLSQLNYAPFTQLIDNDDALEDFLRHGQAAAGWSEQNIVEQAEHYLAAPSG